MLKMFDLILHMNTNPKSGPTALDITGLACALWFNKTLLSLQLNLCGITYKSLKETNISCTSYN